MKVLIPNRRLSYDYGDIVISGVNKYVLIKIFDFNSKNILLEEKYFGDIFGRVVLRDIGKFVEDLYRFGDFSYRITDIVLEVIKFGIKIYDDNNTEVYDSGLEPVVIYPCREEPNFVYSGSIVNQNLSMCRYKVTYPSFKEVFCCYINSSFVIEVFFVDLQGIYRSYRFDVSGGGGDSIIQYDVSVRFLMQFLRQRGNSVSYICRYNIYCGGRSKADVIYEVINLPLQEVKSFVFRNSFFATEIVNVYKPHIVESKWDRDIYSINRRLIVGSNERDKVYKVSTGFITEEQARVVEEMLSSKNVGIINEIGNEVRDVVVVSESYKVSKEKNRLFDIEFSYKLSRRGGKLIEGLPLINNNRIFSSIFSNIFK